MQALPRSASFPAEGMSVFIAFVAQEPALAWWKTHGAALVPQHLWDSPSPWRFPLGEGTIDPKQQGEAFDFPMRSVALAALNLRRALAKMANALAGLYFRVRLELENLDRDVAVVAGFVQGAHDGNEVGIAEAGGF